MDSMNKTLIFPFGPSLSMSASLLCSGEQPCMLLSYRAGTTLLTLAGPSDISRLPYHQSLSKTSGQASGTDSHTDPLSGHSSSKVVSQAPCLQSTNLIRGLAGGAGLGSQLSVSSNAPLPRLLATPRELCPLTSQEHLP